MLAVSKGHPEASVRKFANDGQIEFGESRLQEALSKINNLSDLDRIRWHFVGRLQANKVRGVVKNFDYIHSVDSFNLAKRISRIAGEENRCPQLMLQVKFREDHAKGGFSIAELLEAWPKIKTFSNINIVGLMTISPIAFELDDRKSLFKECRNLADQLELKDCSMGMSGDWQVAVDAGSTWVRVGSLLFGDRVK